MSRARALVCLALLAALAAGCGRPPAAPPEGLEEVVHPALGTVEEAVREQLEGARARLDKALASAPDIDETRVAEIKAAIENGNYEIDADAIADALIRFVPNADYNGPAGDLIFRAWDQTSGTNATLVDATGGGCADEQAAEQVAIQARYAYWGQKALERFQSLAAQYPEYAEASQRGEDVDNLKPLIRHHLEMCKECDEEYQALLRVLEGTKAN